jgi:hypothetical protein
VFVAARAANDLDLTRLNDARPLIRRGFVKQPFPRPPRAWSSLASCQTLPLASVDMTLAVNHIAATPRRRRGRPDLPTALAPWPDLTHGWIFASSQPGDTQFGFDERLEPGRHGRVFAVCRSAVGRSVIDQALQQPEV